jgi:2-keto-4-pentenoate hydratase
MNIARTKTAKTYSPLIAIGILSSFFWGSLAFTQNLDLTNPENQKILGVSFMDNFNTAKPIMAIPANQLIEESAYQIADYYVAEQLKTRGSIAGYKIGTFTKGEYDNGPVDGLSGPITGVMFTNGIHKNGAHISVDCCNMSFVEADFGAVVKSEAINNAKSDLEILAALSGFIPFIEMPDLIQPLEGGTNVSGIATNYDFKNAIIGDLITTEPTNEWIKRINNFSFTMTNEAGELLAEGKIEDAYEPIYRVRNMRDRLLLRGRQLKAGDILSLGNMGAIRPLKENLYFDASVRPVFRGNIATVSYINLDPSDTKTVSVFIDR